MKNLRTKLSYTLYILLVAFLFCGCNVDKQHEHTAKYGSVTKYQGYEISTIEYDGHYYIICRDVVGGRHAASMIHSASCKLCGSKK